MQQPAAEFDQPASETPTFSVAEPSFFDRMSFNFKQRQNIQKAMQDRYEQYGAVVRSGFLGFELTQLFGPEWNQVVYQNRDGLFSSEEGWEFVLKRIFPGSVMAMDGADHLYQRRIMSQAFKKPKLVAYLETMNPVVDQGLRGGSLKVEKRPLLSWCSKRSNRSRSNLLPVCSWALNRTIPPTK